MWRWQMVDAYDLEYMEGNRAIVYSSKSGHASYPHPGTYLQGSDKLGVGIRNDAACSNLSVDSSVHYELVSAEYLGDGVVTEPCWLNFMREWGPTIVYNSRTELDKISMEGVLGSGGGGGGGGSAGGSLIMSTLSKEDNLAMSSEDSSSPDESELELCLGLSLGGGGGGCLGKAQQGPRGQYARILTAKDFPSVRSSLSSSSASSSSSSSSSLSSANVTAGTKRSADSVAAANGASQVVGWPPIRTYRMNIDEKSECKNTAGKANSGNAKEKGHLRASLFVKVNMDGTPIGRKVNLSAQSCYEALAQTLEDMFDGPSMHLNSIQFIGLLEFELHNDPSIHCGIILPSSLGMPIKWKKK
ncbi:Plant protein of unknown function D [Prunus dulcis]|uniref:Auxin-responsive protein n=1 Tax=Prunus dulcis TaxID=3755 RepID=A0A4Y1S1H9_PRUDU|nr:Plant protein of unknown function D [Prunus dulcis]